MYKRQVLVTNKLVLVTAEGNPGKINSLDDLKTTEGVVAVCKEDVPCGTIAHQELKKHDITLKNATTESKVTDVATKVTTGNADAGFIYTTDLAAAKKKGANLGSVELTDVERNEYPAALSKTGSASEAAKKFNEWLKSSDAVSYTPLLSHLTALTCRSRCDRTVPRVREAESTVVPLS